MKILSIHNYYQYPGGEDTVFKSETSLLEKHGHQVIHYIKQNDEIYEKSLLTVATSVEEAAHPAETDRPGDDDGGDAP